MDVLRESAQDEQEQTLRIQLARGTLLRPNAVQLWPRSTKPVGWAVPSSHLRWVGHMFGAKSGLDGRC